MAKINFGGVEENVVTREEFPLEKAREVLKDETIAVIGYGVQGPGQSLNLRDNGFRVIVGQRKGSKSLGQGRRGRLGAGRDALRDRRGRRARYDHPVPAFGRRADRRMAHDQEASHPGKALYFSHGFGITYKERTGIIPPADVDVILDRPEGFGHSLAACSSRAAA